MVQSVQHGLNRVVIPIEALREPLESRNSVRNAFQPGIELLDESLPEYPREIQCEADRIIKIRMSLAEALEQAFIS